MSEKPAPPASTYWLPGSSVLGGPHPLSLGKYGSPGLERLLEAGVTAFLDLTESEEYGIPDYAGPNAEAAVKRLVESAEYANFPIRDGATPDRRQLAEILDHLQVWLDRSRTVYVHCFAGIGRTGTVLGAWLVRTGMSGEQALLELNQARVAAGLFPGSPETLEQRQLVLDWSE